VWADGVVAKQEMRRLSDVCDALALSEAGKEKLIAAAAAPDPERLASAVERIKHDVALRFSLMADAILIAFADGILADPEAGEIVALARRLGVEQEQAMAMARYVEGLLRAPSHKTDPSIRILSLQLEKALAETDPAAAHATVDPERRSWFRDLLGRFGV
jgi:uncharacterized tellurite resistance protein B-like protein